MRRLDGKATIVTGAGSGIGRGIVRRFVAEGARVIAADISGAETETAELAGGDVTPFHCDVTDPKQVEAMVGEAVKRFGRLDLLCNNAGIVGDLKRLHETSVENWDKVIAVNLRGMFLGMKYGIAQMLKQGGGVIVNTGSIGGFRATERIGSYNASKGGVIMLTRQAAIDYARDNIRINAVCPTTVDSNMGVDVPADLIERQTSRIPMGRLASIDDVVSMHLFLSTDEASFLTGGAYLVDGGHYAWQ
jgi:NAD(P)-dependent dehydrogenase (short-subunit alcohol dehydrogenase family)